ncbi:tyrosine-type recombinase/integrase [uncultured Pontibacter sp.]|uniref:tyrosine-type recombinase/integrase n=1 Tax=uncultured Pontibacter sp. TaxID=453356 RepID=UPI002611DACD|nr:tyrosine-type recombinase/integrase [uncultured Pontibacter sp.]
MVFSTKAYMQTPNKQGVGRIYLRYVYKRKPDALNLKLKVHQSKFDSDKGFVYTKYPEASVINLAIRKATQLIEDIAGSLRNPDFKQVKELYLQRMAEIEEQEKEQAEVVRVQNFNNKIDNLYNYITSLEIPEQIKALKARIAELEEQQRELNKLGFRNETFEEQEFKRFLAEYPDTFKTKSKSAQAHIKVWASILLEFSEKTNTPLLPDIFDYKFYEEYARFLMYGERNYFNNNFGNHIKDLRAFLRWLEEEKGVYVNKGYKKYPRLKEEIEVIYLTEEELHLLWEYREEVKPEYHKYIDLCIFGNITGLRISDILRSYWKVENGVLMGKTKKTKGNYQVPLVLDDRIEEILKRYNYNLKLVSSVKYNEYIKIILKALFKKHEINQQPIALMRYKLQEEFVTHHYKHELIASHSNRRGFCTRLWQAGHSERDILLMLGSKSNEVLRRYIHNDTENLVRKVTEKVLAKKQAVLAALAEVE